MEEFEKKICIFINLCVLDQLVYFLVFCFMYYNFVWIYCNIFISPAINWYSNCLQLLTIKKKSGKTFKMAEE